MARGRVLRFAYSLDEKRDRPVSLHLLRDGDAFIELLPVLLAHGYEFGGTLLNIPVAGQKDGSPAVLRELGPSDLLVLTTRPPLHDPNDESRRAIRPGDTLMERMIHRALRRCFEFCDRSRIHLAKAMVDQLPPEYADRAGITFYQYQRPGPTGAIAFYTQLRADWNGRGHAPPSPQRTAVFLIRTALQKGGPWVLCAFGMSGNDGLIWAHLLRTRYHDLLAESGPLFFMGEVVPHGFPRRPFTLEFAESWKLTPLLHTSAVPQVLRKQAQTATRTNGRHGSTGPHRRTDLDGAVLPMTTPVGVAVTALCAAAGDGAMPPPDILVEACQAPRVDHETIVLAG